MGQITLNANNITFSMRDKLVRVEPFGDGCIRVRASRNTRLADETWTVTAPSDTPCQISGGGDSAALTCRSLTAELTKIWNDYQLIFFKNGKEILRTRKEDDGVFRHVEGDHYCVKAVFEAVDNEHFYGLGQEQQSCLDRKGCAYDLIHYNTKSSLPFVYSSLGYGFLWNNPGTGRCELTRNHTLWTSDSACQADYIVIAGDTPAEIMKKYAALTGFAPKFPEWAAGFWQSKLRYESQADLLSVAREYKKRGIPLSAIVIDFFHWTEQGNWEFDPTLWPDPGAMCDELRALNIEPVVSVWPTINPNSRNYAYMDDNNMLVRTENGQYGIFPFNGQQTYVDVTNPAARSFMWEQIRKNYYEYGIKTFWLDTAEPEVHPQQYDNLKLHIGNGSQTALLYPYYYAKTFYEALKAEGQEDVALLIRSAYLGSQKFGTVVWNGDIPSTFEALRQSVVSGLSMAMCGIPWWCSDIGGFHGGDTESGYFREFIVRWFQFGVFCPVTRLHGNRKRPEGHVDRHLEVLEKSGGDNELWSFGERDYGILKDLVALREKLRPYILEHMQAASETGTPLMRPMFFDFYDDETCYALDDQYMFGPDILFAPILNEGQTERQVYLPKGAWVRTTDTRSYDGGRFVTCKAEIHEFIAFVRSGSGAIEYFK